NLRCSWCDTPYTSWNPEGSDLRPEEILARVADHPAARHVVLTGGEPMIVPGIVELSEKLRARGMHITIETAGTVMAPASCDRMSIRPQLANSTREGPFRGQHERLRRQPEVLRALTAAYEYQLKFVIAHADDLHEMRALVNELGAPPDKVILMPEGISRDVLH